MSTHTRRTFLKQTGITSIALGGGVGLAGCAQGGAGTQQETVAPTEDDPLVVGTTGGAFREMYDTYITQAFQEETGIPAKTVAQATPVEVIYKFRKAVDAGRAPVDISLNTPPARIRAPDLWTQWDQSTFSNLEYFDDRFVGLHPETEKVVGAPSQGWYITLSYNTDTFGDAPPTSWATLWDSTYENQMAAMKSPGTGYLLDITASVFFDGQASLQEKSGIEKVFNKLKRIKPNVKFWYNNEANFIQRLKSGEVPVGQLYHDITQVAKSKGAPVDSRFLEEGSVLSYGYLSMLKTSKKREAARKYLEFSMRPDVQDAVSTHLLTTPLIEKQYSDIPQDKYEHIAGPGPDAAIHPNFELYAGDLSEWVNQKWNEFVIES